MTPVRTAPRFRCAHCSRTGIKPTIAKHEPRCFRNPNRFCDACGNTGSVTSTDYADWTYAQALALESPTVTKTEPCPHCVKYSNFLRRQEALGTDTRY